MHPGAVVVIVIGGALISWGAYEAINKLYEWHNNRKEQREYEEYVRMHAEKNQSGEVPVNRVDDDDDDNEPLHVWKQRRDSFNNSQSELRRRHNGFSDMEQLSSLNYELSEMERSIFNRKSLLAREKELLLKEEAELERQRQLLRSRGNSITGVFDDHENDCDYNPFADIFIANNPSTASFSQVQSSIGSSSDKNDYSNALSDKSELESWSDINEMQVRQRSDSSESFEAIHHYQL